MYFLAGMDISRLRFLGRWKHLPSMEHYIQEAVALQIITQLHTHQVAGIETLSEAARLAQPPAAPWQTFFSRSRQVRGRKWYQSLSHLHSHG
jgi:hypothetical protein